jgi:hypothetical protein
MSPLNMTLERLPLDRSGGSLAMTHASRKNLLLS